MGSSPSAQQEAVMMFDSYCKTVIMNCARRYWKREAKRSEHEYLVTDEQLAGHPANKDDFLEQYIITCGNIQAVFHCFALFTAVEQLKENEKTVVVLKYWGGYTDKYYVGNGYAVEWRGFSYGCVRTKVKDRKWKYWYKLPFIQYRDTTVDVPTPEITLGSRLLKRGMVGSDVKALQELLMQLGYALPKYCINLGGISQVRTQILIQCLCPIFLPEKPYLLGFSGFFILAAFRSAG